MAYRINEGECIACAGVCGKTPETAKLQDLLVYMAKSVSACCNVLEGKTEVLGDKYKWVVNS
ncbi:hypothetical protein, partial [Psychrilyobacter sp.]|uniref:hypothetical protein n=1 Tax=Psychrilyobacter sp. TaxID=2586924 RepID=UPI00301965D4